MRCKHLYVSFLSIALASSMAACGGGDDGDGGGQADASISVDMPDAMNQNPEPDAAPASSGMLGDPCTGQGQGDCAAGYECLSLQGSSGSWCSKTCDPMNPQASCSGYTGPGLAYCWLQLDADGDMMADASYCGVVCATQDPAQCPTCDMSCPGTLQCTADLGAGTGCI